MNEEILKKNSRYNAGAYLVCFSTAFFMFYEFMQLNIINSMSTEIIKTFSLSRIELGWFAASFFYANAIFLIPAGVLLDHFPTRSLLILASLSAVIGTIILATSPNLLIATLGRFITGASNAFAFLGTMRLISQCFPKEKIASMAGCAITIGMLGGMFAQTPITFALQFLTWRECLLVSSLLGIIISATMACFIPESSIKKFHSNINWQELFLQFTEVIQYKSNWFSGIYTCFTNLPLAILAALWGNLYLTQGLNLAPTEASIIILTLFLGMMIGAPSWGWWSDRLKKRKLPMLIGSTLLTLVTFCLFMNLFTFSIWGLYGLFFFMGIGAGIQVLGYTYVIEMNRRAIASTAMGFVSVILLTLSALFQPFFGWLITYYTQTFHSQVVENIYTLKDYQFALFILPLSAFLSILVAMNFKETFKLKSRGSE